MNKDRRKIVSLVLLMTLLSSLLVAGCNPAARKPFPARKLEVIGFYEQGWNPLSYGYPSVQKHYRDINILMPFWYTVNADGSLVVSKLGLEQRIIDFAKKHRSVKLVPLVNNGPDIQNMLNNDASRRIAIGNLVRKVRDYNFAGLNIDFELLPPETGDGYTAFIKGLSQELKKENKILSVSVSPKLDGNEEISAAYDYGALATLADIITIMTYDKHTEGSAPGSVAPYDWVERNIRYALKYIPGNKLAVCIGAYGYDWPIPASAGEAKYMGLREIQILAAERGAKIQWDDASQSPFFTYWSNTEHVVWFENGFSISRKVALAKKYGLRGVAIWRVGFEDEQYWRKLNAAL